MLFNSFPFAILVAITFALYYAPLTRRLQLLVLIAASFVFYAYQTPWLLCLLVASIVINVVTSYLIAVDRPSRHRFWAVVGVVANLSLLVFFKYSGLMVSLIPGASTTSIGEFLVLIPLPIGISFFTFQGISLVVEVFRDRDRGVRGDSPSGVVCTNFRDHLRNTALFKSFFPYLVAGPIVKAHEFYPQIGAKYFRDIRWEAAFRALVIGYFLKMVVADNLKDTTFWIEYPHFLRHSSVVLTSMVFGYSMQIFADFAGYSLIAIGLGHLFGYVLPINFNYPYLSRSFAEFWRRWHISLSTWLREYLYFPLGGNRRGEVRIYVNLFIVMFLGGLWHGASWRYAIWGTFHGCLLAVERLLRNKISLPGHWLVDGLRMLIVFSCVTGAWLLFKIANFTDALRYLATILRNEAYTNYLGVACVMTFSIPVILYYTWHLVRQRWTVESKRFEFVILAALIMAIILNSGSPQAFIYFQF